MHSVVLVIIPADAPDPRGMVEQIIEPYRQDHTADGKCAWPYWDYWSLYNTAQNRTTHHLHECRINISDLPENRLFAAVFTPEGKMHDCNCPMPTQKYDEEHVRSDFDRICRPILVAYSDFMGIPIRVHT